jgi:hypothetical protein
MGASQAVLAGWRRPSGWRRAGWALATVASLVLAGVAPVPASAAQAPSGCGAAATGQISCGALLTPGSTALSASAVQPEAAGAAASLPPGLGPLNLRDAYGLSSSALTGGVGQTVAVVTEYGDSTAESDMATYRSEYSLPACGSGCFSVVDENGGTNYPPAGPAGWTLATAQSLDIISSVCPNCHVLLVEAGVTSDGATTVGISDLGAAENTAVRLGAKFVTNTWFTPEATFGTSEPAYDSDYFDHPAVAITAPDGNGAGYGTYYPAASPDVLAVGGTTLTQDNSAARGWAETAWSGTGSGCSPYEAKPSWQTDTGCSTRMLNDVAAVADPSGSPVASYDTSSGGWVEGGGDDVSSALVAAAFALAGTPAAGTFPASYLYAHHGAGLVNDITSGSNGTCTPAYFCTAGTGYDGPAGVGTPASATALGATAPDATLAGGPAVADPENGSLDVFGVGSANGTVWGDSWTKSAGWSGWANMSGTLKGLPLSAVYNPGSGNVEVYGLGSNGDVEEDYSSNGSTWSGWNNLGGPFAGSPSAVYDPLDNSLDVWEVGTTNGTAFEDSWKAGSGWSGWQNKSGTFSQSGLDAAYDPATATMHVFGVGNASGTVWGGSYTPSGGFSGWSNMSGEMTGRLSAVYDPLNRNIEVYGEDLSGYTEESYSTTNGATWTGWGELASAGPSLPYPPTAVYSPLGNSVEVWATGNGTTFDDSWTSSGGWAAWQNRNGAIGSGLAPVFDPNSGDLRIFGVGQTNGTAWGAALTPSGAWEAWGNMNGTLQTGDMS